MQEEIIEIISLIVKIKDKQNQEWVVLRKLEQEDDIIYTISEKLYKEYFVYREGERRTRIKRETREKWNKQRNIKRNIEKIYEEMKGFSNENSDFDEELNYKKELVYEKVYEKEVERYHVYVIEEVQENLVLKEGWVKVKIEELENFCEENNTLREYNKRIVRMEKSNGNFEEKQKELDLLIKENIKNIAEGIEIAKIENEKEMLEGFKESIKEVIRDRILGGIGYIGEYITIENFGVIIKEESIEVMCIREIRKICGKICEINKEGKVKRLSYYSNEIFEEFRECVKKSKKKFEDDTERGVRIARNSVYRNIYSINIGWIEKIECNFYE